MESRSRERRHLLWLSWGFFNSKKESIAVLEWVHHQDWLPLLHFHTHHLHKGRYVNETSEDWYCVSSLCNNFLFLDVDFEHGFSDQRQNERTCEA